MERKELINEIINFCFEHGLFKGTVKVSELKIKIRKGLNDSEFIENLINTIIIKTRYRKSIDTEKIKALLLGLEEIRLELEYKK